MHLKKKFKCTFKAIQSNIIKYFNNKKFQKQYNYQEIKYFVWVDAYLFLFRYRIYALTIYLSELKVKLESGLIDKIKSLSSQKLDQLIQLQSYVKYNQEEEKYQFLHIFYQLSIKSLRSQSLTLLIYLLDNKKMTIVKSLGKYQQDKKMPYHQKHNHLALNRQNNIFSRFYSFCVAQQFEKNYQFEELNTIVKSLLGYVINQRKSRQIYMMLAQFQQMDYTLNNRKPFYLQFRLNQTIILIQL
ncbi:unnamed protein product [Paramecium sonneborni]|uniref:Uncharacterized protein n=1 Tax=Paramecium sonneborni TaxID=65129 RepID=A0A8S1RNH3_9CILI|nr:unnamed protein product [Paramecium sonneborni]